MPPGASENSRRIESCGKNFLRELGLKVPGKADFLPVLSAIPLFFLFAAMTFLARSAGLPVSVQGLIGYAENCSPVMFFLILLTAGFLAPVSEEIAYRRTVYGFLRESFPGKTVGLRFLLHFYLRSVMV